MSGNIQEAEQGLAIPPPSPSTENPASMSSSRTVSVENLHDTNNKDGAMKEVNLSEKPSFSSLPAYARNAKPGEKIYPADYVPVSEEALIPIPRPPKDAPPVKKHRASKWIRFQLWFNTYRKFFTIVIIVNGILQVLRWDRKYPYGAEYPGAQVLGNIMVAVLVRNEIFGRILYLIVNTLFAKDRAPLWFRLACTSVLQHLGGIHSGCAVSGLVWLFTYVADVYRHRAIYDASLLATGLINLVVIFIALVAAFPWVRNTHHNVFEKTHRYVGWTGVVATWVFAILWDLWDPKQERYILTATRVFTAQTFWYSLFITVFVALPWFFVRKVPIHVEIPSPKVAVLRFERGMQQGLLARISRSAIREYHAFGTISEGVDARYHYLICGVQGDFTKGLVNDMPTHIWTRELKFAGVSNTSAIYKRGIRVCTGTGLGAALSSCLQSPNWFLIWIGSDMEKTFGPTISALIHDNLGPERRLLWDSKARKGRPDTLKILKEIYKTWEAEVIFITSNYEGNQELMEGCKEHGMHAFGTLWDF